jgi:hypothetical protein
LFPAGMIKTKTKTLGGAFQRGLGSQLGPPRTLGDKRAHPALGYLLGHGVVHQQDLRHHIRAREDKTRVRLVTRYGSGTGGVAARHGTLLATGWLVSKICSSTRLQGKEGHSVRVVGEHQGQGSGGRSPQCAICFGLATGRSLTSRQHSRS